MKPRYTLEQFALFLESRNLKAEITIAGAAALQLLEITTDETLDVDVVDPDRIPANILLAAMEFASRPDLGLDVSWLNAAASVYAQHLPQGWRDRTIFVLETPALTVRSVCRTDLLKLKVFALCDRRRDLEDCVALNPTPAELSETRAWLEGLERRGPHWQEDLAHGIEVLERALEEQREPDREIE